MMDGVRLTKACDSGLAVWITGVGGDGELDSGALGVDDDDEEEEDENKAHEVVDDGEEEAAAELEETKDDEDDAALWTHARCTAASSALGASWTAMRSRCSDIPRNMAFRATLNPENRPWRRMLMVARRVARPLTSLRVAQSSSTVGLSGFSGRRAVARRWRLCFPVPAPVRLRSSSERGRVVIKGQWNLGLCVPTTPSPTHNAFDFGTTYDEGGKGIYYPMVPPPQNPSIP